MRTSSSWFKILCYYILFLVVVSALFLFFSWYDIQGTSTESLTKNKRSLCKQSYPGITFIGSNDDRYLNSFIWYSVSEKKSWKDRKADKYVKILRKFLQAQEDACSGDDCTFKNSSLGPCSKLDFGYSEKKPCVFLKLSRLENWKPKSLHAVDDLPDGMKTRVDTSRNCVWVDCKACSLFDEEQIGNFSYYPEAAFHEDYFTLNKNQHAVIALQLSYIKPGYVLRLECELFADNIFKTPIKNSKVFLYIDD